MSELLKEEKYVVKLADKEYKLLPLNLNMMCAIEDEFGCSLDKIKDRMDERVANSLRQLLFVLLNDRYPELTKEVIGSLLTKDNIADVRTNVERSMQGE